MHEEGYGLVVEAPFDSPFYAEVIQKICQHPVSVDSLVAGDRRKLMRKFPALLWTFKSRTPVGGAVDKALVIQDADSDDPTEVEQLMKERIAGKVYPYRGGLAVHAVRRTMETWLLADTDAINRVASLAGRQRIPGVPGPLESIRDPKSLLQKVLARAGLLYTPEVCRRIARELDLDRLRVECPGFAKFQQKVLDP